MKKLPRISKSQRITQIKAEADTSPIPFEKTGGLLHIAIRALSNWKGEKSISIGTIGFDQNEINYSIAEIQKLEWTVEVKDDALIIS